MKTFVFLAVVLAVLKLFPSLDANYNAGWYFVVAFLCFYVARSSYAFYMEYQEPAQHRLPTEHQWFAYLVVFIGLAINVAILTAIAPALFNQILAIFLLALFAWFFTMHAKYS